MINRFIHISLVLLVIHSNFSYRVETQYIFLIYIFEIILDTENIKFVFAAVRDTILQSHLVDWALM